MSVKHALLALLARGPAGTYQLRKDFESATGTTWPLNIGQVATTLARLERDGLVTRLDRGHATTGSTAPGLASAASEHSVRSRGGAEPATADGVGDSSGTSPEAPSSRPTTLTASGRDVAAWSLTNAGREELADWWASPVARRAPERDELVIKLALATASPDVDIAALIQRQRQATQTVLHEINRARRAAGDEDLAAALVLDHHVFVVEAELRWLDDAEGRLARAAADGRRS
ncbi:Transcriptional regulator PadR-like family protein [Actinomyces ruminicola]|uniref:Transcriptional regulator PadR-like family protein n=1 Tax=Actinomyces ruminicola TaxID=332524 RepID=A0A1H0CLF5_9ACTO|nr:PadR family transcriptional regulator [Actinomyces ruminicola]SDN58710.1 Transcriptional regulator PadR-like family protein [Actinomyces ruminicola]